MKPVDEEKIICPTCDGSGHIGEYPCEDCCGSGEVKPDDQDQSN